jgi:hypothetical protein
MFRSFLSAALVLEISVPAMAYDMRDLRPGLYVMKGANCDQLGSSAEMSFDGRNFAGHYQVCITKNLGGGKIRNTCIEHQGLNRPTPGQVETSPDKESYDISVKILSPTDFSYDRGTYKYCTKG